MIPTPCHQMFADSNKLSNGCKFNVVSRITIHDYSQVNVSQCCITDIFPTWKAFLPKSSLPHFCITLLIIATILLLIQHKGLLPCHRFRFLVASILACIDPGHYVDATPSGDFLPHRNGTPDPSPEYSQCHHARGVPIVFPNVFLFLSNGT